MAYLLSDSMAEVLILGFALFVNWPLPLTALMILWINLISDGLPAVALTLDEGLEHNVAKQSQTLDFVGREGIGPDCFRLNCKSIISPANFQNGICSDWQFACGSNCSLCFDGRCFPIVCHSFREFPQTIVFRRITRERGMDVCYDWIDTIINSRISAGCGLES